MAAVIKFFKRPSGIITGLIVYTTFIIGGFQVIRLVCDSGVSSANAICVTTKKVVRISDSVSTEKVLPVTRKVDGTREDVIRMKAILEYMANPNTVSAANRTANQRIDSIKTQEETQP